MASFKITEYFLVLNFWKGKDLRGIIQITRFKGKYFHPIICNLFKRCQVPRCGHLGKQLGSRAHLVIFLPFTATWVLITRYLRNNNNYNISVGFFAFCYDFFKINHILFTQLRGHFKLHRISVMSLSLRIRQGFCHMPLTYNCASIKSCFSFRKKYHISTTNSYIFIFQAYSRLHQKTFKQSERWISLWMIRGNKTIPHILLVIII